MQLNVTLAEAELLWQRVSDRFEATWLGVGAYSDDEIAVAITKFVERDW